MSPSQKQYLLEAIDAAQDWGGCKYVKDGQPCCVIGQYLFRRGITVETLEAFDAEENPTVDKLPLSNYGVFLDEEDKTFLRNLQFWWDNGMFGSSRPEPTFFEEDDENADQLYEEWLRAELKKVVEEYFHED